MKIIALGTGANGGIPEIYCNCRVCNVARENPKEARFRSSIAVELESGKFLIVDASPDLRMQLIRNKIEIKSISAMLLTHAHYDHIGGLFEFYLVGYLDIDIYSHPGVLDCFSRQLIRNGDSKKTYDLRFHSQYRKLEFDQTLITGFEVPHTSSTYGPTLGFEILENNKKVIYIPDFSRYTNEILKRISGSDVAILDGTFMNHSYYNHVSVRESLISLKKVDLGLLFFTHVNHTEGLHDELNEKVNKEGGQFLRDGEIIDLSSIEMQRSD